MLWASPRLSLLLCSPVPLLILSAQWIWGAASVELASCSHWSSGFTLPSTSAKLKWTILLGAEKVQAVPGKAWPSWVHSDGSRGVQAEDMGPALKLKLFCCQCKVLLVMRKAQEFCSSSSSSCFRRCVFQLCEESLPVRSWGEAFGTNGWWDESQSGLKAYTECY